VAFVKPEILQNLELILVQRLVFPFVFTYILNTTKAHHTYSKNFIGVSSLLFTNFIIFRCIVNLILSSL
jgi:hypothetical protein